jgi:hypothetical protein
MIDFVFWSFVAALLPAVLDVSLRILLLVYWSFRAVPWPIVLHGCVRVFSAAPGARNGVTLSNFQLFEERRS